MSIATKSHCKRLADGSLQTCCRRAELAPQGSTPTVSPQFRSQLKTFDSGLELVWNPWQQHWTLFRVIYRGAARCNDMLYKEISLCGPKGTYRCLGSWVFNVLRSKSLLRYDPNPDRHGLVMNQILDDADAEVQKKWDDKADDLDEHMNKDLGMAQRGYTSAHGDGDFIMMDRPAAGRERIWGPKTSKRRNTIT